MHVLCKLLQYKKTIPICGNFFLLLCNRGRELVNSLLVLILICAAAAFLNFFSFRFHLNAQNVK